MIFGWDGQRKHNHNQMSIIKHYSAMMLMISTITIQRISKMITVIGKMNSAFLNLHVINLKSKLANALEVCSSICFKEVQWGALKAIHSQMSICHSWEKYYCNVSVGIFHRLWNWYSVLQMFLHYRNLS